MKSLRLSFGVVAVVLLQALLGPGAARSEPGGLHLNLTPYGGFGTWAKDVNLDDKPLFGGRVGLGFGRHLGIEGHYGWMKTHTEYGTGDSLFTAASLSARSTQYLTLGTSYLG